MSKPSVDGTIDFSGGQNSGVTSDKIQKNQVAKAINTSFRNASVTPRPRFNHIPVTVITQGSEQNQSYQTIFDRGKFQGERFFHAGDRSYAISVRGGLVFSIEYSTGIATVLPLAQRTNPYARRLDIQEAASYMVIFDAPNNPIYIKERVAKRTNVYAKDGDGVPQPEIPPTRLGVFVQSRLWVATTNEFTAGDFSGDPTRPEAPITFQEVLLPGGPFVGQAFNTGVGSSKSYITAMGYMSSRNPQSAVQATQYGPLYVATNRSLSLYKAELPREQWEQTTFGRLELWGTGIVGQRAHTLMNSDVVFQSNKAQIHSLTKNQNDERSGWATTVISREVEDWLVRGNRDYLDTSIITYNNRNTLLVGANPSRMVIRGYNGKSAYDYYHNGMVALELDNVSTLVTSATPSWAGLWTGVRPMEILTDEDNTYVVSKDVDGFNRTYIVRSDAIFDTWNGINRKVKSRIYTRAYDHENPFLDKRETTVEVGIGEIQHKFNCEVYRKPLDQYRWGKWGNYTYNPPKCTGNPNVCTVQGVRSWALPEPEEVLNNAFTGERVSTYRESQLRFDIEGGTWRLYRIKLKGVLVNDADNLNIQGECDLSTATCSTRCDVSDWDFYSTCPKPEIV